VSIQSATAWQQRGHVLGRVAIGDSQATITDDGHRRCVSWASPAGLIHEVCSSVPSGTNLDADELIKIARSIK
jgi:hypothetical protein